MRRFFTCDGSRVEEQAPPAQRERPHVPENVNNQNDDVDEAHKFTAHAYEFMPKGSLDHHIYAHTKLGPGLPQEYPVLNWETRMSIAVGVAEALNYLQGR
ncbi:unnamed protein product [Microthlaspi erraticum]|uniref:Uncharacterized protein n=1 Tax=Microthlaspi erraticum TaxID=1685480 RepID=A0A6D2JR10_9BRAS|nr:unnamed protein product [Microthlaspi erraticum]